MDCLPCSSLPAVRRNSFIRSIVKTLPGSSRSHIFNNPAIACTSWLYSSSSNSSTSPSTLTEIEDEIGQLFVSFALTLVEFLLQFLDLCRTSTETVDTFFLSSLFCLQVFNASVDHSRQFVVMGDSADLDSLVQRDAKHLVGSAIEGLRIGCVHKSRQLTRVHQRHGLFGGQPTL